MPVLQPCFARIKTRSAEFLVLNNGNICISPKFLFSNADITAAVVRASDIIQIWPPGRTRAALRLMTIVVSVNGKRANDFVVPVNIAENDLIESAKKAAERQLTGATIIKTIVVPKKLVNFVVKK